MHAAGEKRDSSRQQAWSLSSSPARVEALTEAKENEIKPDLQH